MKLLIKRFDSQKSYFQEFDVEVKDDETILEVLDKIRNKERSLTYRSFCRSSICGTCAVRVNGISVLACKEKAIKFGDEIVIEPLNNLKVIRDLVVEHSYIQDVHKKLKLHFVDEINENEENLQSPGLLKMFEKQTECIMCMACYSECEALMYDKNFASPFAFTKVYRFVFDSRDKMDEQERIETAKENSLYSCVSCQKCFMVCPKGISSMNDIKMLQSKDKNPPFENTGGFGMDFGGFF